MVAHRFYLTLLFFKGEIYIKFGTGLGRPKVPADVREVRTVMLLIRLLYAKEDTVTRMCEARARGHM